MLEKKIKAYTDELLKTAKVEKKAAPAPAAGAAGDAGDAGAGATPALPTGEAHRLTLTPRGGPRDAGHLACSDIYNTPS